jgi:thiamine transporter
MKKLFNVEFDTKSIAYMAMFIALQIVLELVFNIFPSQPEGGNITMDLLPIILASYLMGSGYGLIIGFTCCLLHFALGLATFYGPWSVVLDYLVPLSIVGLSAVFKNIKIGKTTIYTGIIITMILKFISHYLSGAWLFGAYAPEGVSPWVYSFGYNIIYCLPTLILCYIGFAVIYPRLKNHF